jgi:hypothetical protein
MIMDNWTAAQIERDCVRGAAFVVFGVGHNAKIFMCVSHLAKYVSYFIDNNPLYHGRLFSVLGKDYPIKKPDEVLRSAEDMLILVTPHDYVSVETQISDANDAVKVFSLNRHNAQDDELITEILLNTKLKIDLMRYIGDREVKRYYEDLFDIRVNQFVQPDYVVAPQVIFILSNKCSLRCEHCSMLMPAFKTPWELPVAESIQYIDNFLRGVDEVLSFNLVGGEPLLYGDLPPVIEHLQKNDKVKRISLATNCSADVSERMLEAFKLDKVEIALSDYGNLVQMAELVELFERNAIKFVVLSEQEWTRFGGTDFRGKPRSILKAEFRRCFVSASCKSLYKDKFFVCERAARMYMLGGIYDASCDCVSLDMDAGDNEIRKSVQKLLHIDIANACNYCDAGKKDADIIPAGKQIGKSRRQSAYTIAKRTKIVGQIP